MLLGLLALAACAPPPRPFEHDDSEAPVRQLPQDKVELAIAPPAQHAAGNGQPGGRRARHRAAILRHRRHRPAGAGADPGERHHEHARCRRDGHRGPDRLAHRRRAEVAGPRHQPHARAAGGLCRGERTTGVAHRPAGRAARGDADRQAADSPGALARPGRRRHERAGGAATRHRDGHGGGERARFGDRQRRRNSSSRSG